MHWILLVLKERKVLATKETIFILRNNIHIKNTCVTPGKNRPKLTFYLYFFKNIVNLFRFFRLWFKRRLIRIHSWLSYMSSKFNAFVKVFSLFVSQQRTHRWDHRRSKLVSGKHRHTGATESLNVRIVAPISKSLEKKNIFPLLLVT